MIKKLPVLLLGLFFLLFPRSVSAAYSSEVVEAIPNSITSRDDIVQVKISITDLPSESYFRVAFQKQSGSSYFGYFKNDLGNWVQIKSLGTSECADYYHVVDTGTTEIVLELKVGDSNYSDPGEHLVKTHRYTVSCNSNSASINSQIVSINIPTPTPTPTEEPTFAPTDSPTSTPSLTKTSTPKSTVKAASTKRPKSTKKPGEKSNEEIILGLRDGLKDESPSPIPEEEEKGGSSVWSILLIVLGMVSIGVAGYSFYVQKGKGYTKKNGDEEQKPPEKTF